MPILPPTMQGLIISDAVLLGIAGPKLPDLASAISTAVCQYLLTSSIITSTNTGLGPGVGSQVGLLTGLSPQLMANLMGTYATSLGLSGTSMLNFFNAVSFGIVMATNTLVLQGTVMGIGPGVGIGKVTGLVPLILAGLILDQAIFRTLFGSMTSNLAAAVAFGICTHIMTAGIVNVVNIGAFAPPPVGPIPVSGAPGFGIFV